MKKRIIAAILVIILVMPNSGITVLSKTEKEGGADNPKITQVVPLQTDSANQNVIYQASKDPTNAGKELEEIDSSGAYDATLKEVLKGYYKDEDNASIKAFTRELSDRGNEICSNFQAAEEERNKKAKDLGYVPGRVLLAYDSDVVTDKKLNENIEILDATCADMVEVNDDLSMAVVDISLEDTVLAAVEKLSCMEGVEYAQPDYIYTADTTTSDWINDSKANVQYYLDVINAAEAWDFMDTVPYSKTLVAVIDSGVDYTHKELANVINMEKSVAIEEDGTIRSLYDTTTPNHGTHVSGIIAATGNNKQGIAGVGSGYLNDIVDLMMIDCDCCDEFMTSSLVNAISYASNQGARVINMSFGGPVRDSLVANAIKAANASGSLVIASAGNNASDKDCYPANLPWVVSVISTDADIQRSYFSSYGNSKSEKNKISAPGSKIYSTVPGNQYEYYNGTSMAAPIVTAVAAMMYAANPRLTPEEVKSILFTTTKDLYTKGYDKDSGYGLVNAKKAVMMAYQTVSANKLTSLNISNSKNTISRGETLQLKTVVNKGAENTTLIWSSSDPFIATVDANGLVTAKESGVVTITVSSTNGRRAAVTITCICSKEKGVLSTPTIEEEIYFRYFYYNDTDKWYNIFWSKVDGADYYGIYRSSTRNGVYTQIGTSQKNIFYDTFTTPGNDSGFGIYKTVYYYKIKAFSNDVNLAASEYSSICIGCREADTRSVLWFNAVDENSVSISWYGQGFCELLRTEDAETNVSRKWTKIAEFEPSISTLVYVDHTVEIGHMYYYRINYYSKADGVLYHYDANGGKEYSYTHTLSASIESSLKIHDFPVIDAEALQDDWVWAEPRLLFSWMDTNSYTYFVVAKSMDGGKSWGHYVGSAFYCEEENIAQQKFDIVLPINFNETATYKVAYAKYDQNKETFLYGKFSDEITITTPQRLLVPEYTLSYTEGKVKVTLSPSIKLTKDMVICYDESYYNESGSYRVSGEVKASKVTNNSFYIKPRTTAYRCRYSMKIMGKKMSLKSPNASLKLVTRETSSKYSEAISPTAKAGIINSITVPSKIDDGTAISSKNITVNTSSDGKKVFQWYLDNRGVCGTQLSSAPTKAGTYWVGVSVLESLQYKAIKEKKVKFTIKKGCKITLNGNSGTAEKKSVTVVQGSEIGTLPTAKRSGYQFLGWYTARSGGKKVSASFVCSKATTLYAHWKSVKPSTQTIKSIKTSSSSKVKIKLSKKVANAGAYQIEYSTYKDFKKAQTYTIKKNTSLTVSISNLKRGKTYYFRVKARSVKKDSTGKYVYSKAVSYTRPIKMR